MRGRFATDKSAVRSPSLPDAVVHRGSTGADTLAAMQFGLLSSSHDVGREHWLGGTAFERVEIEIGPGNCGYLTAAARLAPRSLHVGIEVRPSSLARARGAGPLPANLRLIESDGGWIVRHLLAPRSIDAVHVYFPDPWWKKRHQKRRLFQSDFCEALAEVLTVDGAVYVVTDVVPLFAEIAERMTAAGFRAEPWNRAGSDVACSAYEQKYRRQRRSLEQAVFRNQ